MATVDQDRQFGLPGPADVGEGVESGAHSPAGVEDVVDHDHAAVRYVGRDLGHGCVVDRAQGTVIPVFADVELADRDLDAFELGNELTEKTGQVDSTGVNADDDNGFRAAMALEDLMGDAANGSLDVLAVHHLGHRLDANGTLPISLLPGLTGPRFKGESTLADHPLSFVIGTASCHMRACVSQFGDGQVRGARANAASTPLTKAPDRSVE